MGVAVKLYECQCVSRTEKKIAFQDLRPLKLCGPDQPTNEVANLSLVGASARACTPGPKQTS